MVCSGTDASRAEDREVLAWLRENAGRGCGIGAIRTGGYTLARAGLPGGGRPVGFLKLY